MRERRVVADLELVQKTAAERALKIEDRVVGFIGDFDNAATDPFGPQLAAVVAEIA